MHADPHDVLVRRLHVLVGERGRNIHWLAQESGVSQGYLSEVLNREKSPTVRTLHRLANALGVETWELLRDARGEGSEATTAE